MKTANKGMCLVIGLSLAALPALAGEAKYEGFRTKQDIVRGNSRATTSTTAEAPIFRTNQDVVANTPVVTEESRNFEVQNTQNVMDRNVAVAPIDAAATATTVRPSFTEDQAAEFLKTANDAEINAAQLAQRRASNQKVKNFAAMMETEHKKNKRDGRKLLGKLDVGTDRSEPARVLKQESSASIEELKKLRGSEFDQAYMANQVQMHRALLTDIDQRLIPASEQPELQQFLRETRGHVKHHLSQAEEIQNSLGTAVR